MDMVGKEIVKSGNFPRAEANNRKSRSQMFFQIGAVQNLVNFTEKHLCWSLFSIKLQA